MVIRVALVLALVGPLDSPGELALTAADPSRAPTPPSSDPFRVEPEEDRTVEPSAVPLPDDEPHPRRTVTHMTPLGGSALSSQAVDARATGARQEATTADWLPTHNVEFHGGLTTYWATRADRSEAASAVPIWNLALGYAYGGLHKRFTVGIKTLVHPWEAPESELHGHPLWWTVDGVTSVRARVPFGRRCSAFLGPIGGVTLDFSRTTTELMVVREDPGLGLGWNAGAEVGLVVYLGAEVAITLNAVASRRRFRHRWHYTAVDGSFDASTEKIRYDNNRLAINAGMMVGW